MIYSGVLNNPFIDSHFSEVFLGLGAAAVSVHRDINFVEC